MTSAFIFGIDRIGSALAQTIRRNLATMTGPYRILVVDDDVHLRGIYAAVLSDAGYDVEEAGDGDIAIACMEFSPVDAVVLDLRMPNVHGIEVLKTVRARSRSLPILVLSGHLDETIVEQLFAEGVSDVMQKPVIPALLAHRISGLLENQSPIRASADSGPVAFTMFNVAFADRYCESCRTSVTADAQLCGECKQCAPDGGWPSVLGSPYPYLGHNVGDRLTLDHYLGGGANGQVYRAVDRTFRRTVAVKVVKVPPANHKSGQLMRDQLKQEILATAKVSSAHAVTFFDALPLDDDTIALIMDLVEGDTLTKYVDRNGPMSVASALLIAKQAGYALHAAHRHGLIHRDVKPDNILIEPMPNGSWFARLVDFGVVRVLGGANVERKGLFFGTPWYSAPEQVSQHAEVDERTDVYQLGCVLHFLLTGGPPFPKKTAGDALRAHLYSTRPEIPDHAFVTTTIAREVNALIDVAMQKAPEYRFQTMVEMIKRIELCEIELIRNEYTPTTNPGSKLSATLPPRDTLTSSHDLDSMLREYLKND